MTDAIPRRRNMSRPAPLAKLPPIPADVAEAEPPTERVFVMPEATLPDPPAAAAAPAPEAAQAAPPRKPPTITIAAQLDGFPIAVAFEGRLAQLPDALAKLRAIGATPPSAPTPPPAPEAEPDELPDGWRWCAKHRAPMRPRNKQGDTWVSHNVGTKEQPCWCKGYRGPDSPGYEVD